MKKEQYYLEIPEEISNDLKINEEVGGNINAELEGFSVQIGKSAYEKVVPLKAVISSVLVAFIINMLFFFNRDTIALTGPNSIASLVIIVGTITGIMSFTYFYIKNKNSEIQSLTTKLYWRNFPVVLLAYTSLVVVGLLLGFKVLGTFFMGATFDSFTASYIGALFVGGVNYLLIYFSNNLTPTSLIKTLIFIILGGVSIAMVTNKDQQWWLYNFSFLGSPLAANSWQFNLTLMLSSLLMIALIDYLFTLLYEIEGKKKGLVILKILLIITALCLGGVGFFPYNDDPFYQEMHNRTAQFLVYLFIILIGTIRWLLPNVPKQFLQLSYTLGGSLLLVAFLFQGIHYLSLTAFELISFGIAFAWLLLLLQCLINIIMKKGKVYEVVVSKM